MRLTITDPRLLPAFHQGDNAAYSTIYQHFVGPIALFVEEVVKDRATAEDIAAETFIKAFRKNKDFVSVEKLRAFLYVAASNAAKDFLKTQKRQQEIKEEIKYQQAASFDNQELSYIRIEAARAIELAINDLPAQCGQVIRLSFIEGLTLPQIATTLNIAYKTVQNHKSRGMELLRMRLVKDRLLPAVVVIVALQLLNKIN